MDINISKNKFLNEETVNIYLSPEKLEEIINKLIDEDLKNCIIG